MGYDAFGLPAEQYAIQTGQHPAVTTANNIKRYREQMDLIGFSYDWEREVQTCDPAYYKWTQWIFLKLFNSWFNRGTQKAEPIETLQRNFKEKGTNGLMASCSTEQQFTADQWSDMNEREKQETLLNYRLAFISETAVNWCPKLGTVLANEEVKDGLSERGGFPVERKKMKQWSLRITAYADRLLEGLDGIEWSDALKDMQRNWIGRSEGAMMQFPINGSDASIEVFTTRPDTVFGATFMVIAPEHELVDIITTAEQKEEVQGYVEVAKSRSERDRMSEVKKVTGVFSGAYAINPLTKKNIPVWIADYVLASYGTGAIMAVPSGDQRDWNFATHFNLPIIPVVSDSDCSKSANENKDGVMINSGLLNGLKIPEAIQKIIAEIGSIGVGEACINYKLRDAVFSRQRYWGEPFPIFYKDGVPYSLDEKDLPLELPEVDKYLPTETGEPPLARAENWKTKDGYPLDCNTMPGWAGSSWYYLRYMDARNNNEFISQKAVSYWNNVDLYIGGAEHATGHLLYVRFWTKFLYDLGFLPFEEPAKKLVNQGMILGEGGEKMSKSKGNVINPDDLVEKYGADTLRMYEMFLGPLEQPKPWDTHGIEGVHKFLVKLWRLYHGNQGKFNVSNGEPSLEELKVIHKTIKKIGSDIERLSFNTSVSAFMICVNELLELKSNNRSVLHDLAIIVSPFAPHIAEELWELLGNNKSVSKESFPEYDEQYLVEDVFSYPVSFNGKMRFKIDLPTAFTKEEVEKEVLANEQALKWLAGKPPKRVIVVEKRIVNIVV
jgi:leucyl-tRNA synthetase